LGSFVVGAALAKKSSGVTGFSFSFGFSSHLVGAALTALPVALE